MWQRIVLFVKSGRCRVVYQYSAQPQINPSDSEPGIFRENSANAIAAGVGASSQAGSSASKVLKIYDKWVSDFLSEGFWLLYHLNVAEWYTTQARGPIYHNIAYSATVTKVVHKSEFKLTKVTEYLALTGEIWGVLCDDLA